MLKKFLRLTGLLFILPVAGSEKTGGFLIDNKTNYETLQKRNHKYLSKFRSKFSWNDYIALIDELAKDRYLTVAGEDFNKTTAQDKVVIYFRHDMDNAPFHGLKMSAEEKKRNLRGSYYVLHSARYYGTTRPGAIERYAAMDRLYKEIYANGHEIGVHNDLFGMQLLTGIEPEKFQAAELEYYKSIGIPVVGTVCHGSIINSWGLNNTWLFSDFKKTGEYNHKGKIVKYGIRSVKDFGFDYEGYRLKCNVRLSDISKYDAAGLLERIRACKPGDRVSLLLHPCHWRREK